MKFGKYAKIGLSAFAAIILVASYKVGWTIAQSAQESPDGGRPVSEPEPSRIPVKEQIKRDTSGGIDPELGTIQEPDLSDVQPALRTDGDGDWKTPDQIAREKLKEQAKKDAEALLRFGENNNTAQGGELPKLMAPKIPVIPMNLLFPQNPTVAGATKYADEIRGTTALFFGLNRETGQSMRFRVAVGKAVSYNQITINLKNCFRSNPDEPRESWAYVDVIDNGEPPHPQLAVLAQRNRAKMREANGRKLIKQGWIIASSPDVTAIDHPFLDVFLLQCEGGVDPVVANAVPTTEVKTGKKKAKTDSPIVVDPAAEEAPSPEIVAAPPPKDPTVNQ
jgi:hypothetical protein